MFLFMVDTGAVWVRAHSVAQSTAQALLSLARETQAGRRSGGGGGAAVLKQKLLRQTAGSSAGVGQQSQVAKDSIF